LVGNSEGNKSLRRSECRWNGVKMDLREVRWEGCTRLIWFRIGINDGLLWIQEWTFGFH
jgi:hypothetical protein